MTIGNVINNTDGAAISGAPAVYQPMTSGTSTFSETLKSIAADGGGADLDAIFSAAGLRYNLSPNLLKAIAKVESGFKSDAVSRVGAIGIMQLMPGTAKSLGVTDPFDPAQNIMGGAKYVREMLDRFDGDIELALAAYNAGPAAVAKYGGIPPYSETQSYVPKVLNIFGGGDITAGIAPYGSLNLSGKAANDAKSPVNINETLSQMLLMKIIEMQMQSSDDDDKNKVF